MKTYLVASLLLIFSSLAQAEVVKLFAKNCSTQKAVIQGSGILFNYKGEQFVVSSEHATPASKGLCFSYSLRGAAPAALNLIASDWENGLSILKLTTAQAGVTKGLQDFAPESNLNDEVVTVSGFPSESSAILNDSARVVMRNSQRSPFANNQALIEIIGIQAEFGMSGGALISKSTNQILGLLSHQRLVMNPGQASRANENSQNASNHILVIPAPVISAWIFNTLAGQVPNFSRLNSETISGQGMTLKQQPNTQMRLRKQGGGDGVGITGENTEDDGVLIEISISDLANLSQSTNLNPEIAWAQKMTPRLMKNKIVLSRMIFFDSSQARIEVKSIKNLADFVNSMRTGSALPLIETANTSSVSKELLDLKKEITDLSEIAELRDLQITLQALIDAKMQYPNFKMAIKQANQFENHTGWKHYFSENFDTAVHMKSFVETLK